MPRCYLVKVGWHDDDDQPESGTEVDSNDAPCSSPIQPELAQEIASESINVYSPWELDTAKTLLSLARTQAAANTAPDPPAHTALAAKPAKTPRQRKPAQAPTNSVLPKKKCILIVLPKPKTVSRGIQTIDPNAEKSRKSYKCLVCDKNYASSSNLSRHKQTHRSLDSPKAKRCQVCSKKYVSMSAFRMHLLTHTLGHKCDLCGKTYSRHWLLRGHYRFHTGEKPYVCSVCNKAFADRSNFRVHQQTHSDERKYGCTVCGKVFYFKSYLTKHLQVGACMHKRKPRAPRRKRNTPPGSA